MDEKPQTSPDPDQKLQQNSADQKETMSTLTMTSSPHPGLKSEYAWDSNRSSAYTSPANDPKSIALPPIRQAFPEFMMPIGPQEGRGHRMPSPGRMTGPSTSPEYVHAGVEGKRRRSSMEDEQEGARVKQVPRIYRDDRATQRPMPSLSLHISTDNEARVPTRASPYTPAGGLPTPVEVSERQELRPLPGLPPKLALEREGPASAASIHRRYGDSPHSESFHHGQRHYTPTGPPTAPPTRGPADPQSPVYRHAGYHHYPPFASHAPHYPMTTATSSATTRSPIHAIDPSYPPNGYPHHHHHQHPRDMPGYGEPGTAGVDGKQRKRRGNLPKETTDKLRAWFVGNLSHPYPSEDEKQKLMKQTGLQMNQISNWFINARRRQLPAMIENAQAEHDAIHSRMVEAPPAMENAPALTSPMTQARYQWESVEPQHHQQNGRRAAPPPSLPADVKGRHSDDAENWRKRDLGTR